jgi:superfamily II DNA/RNA helicase
MSGNNAPLPITTWDDEDLGPVVENAIKLAGYSRPTPVQRYAIPVIVAQRDLMACAQTGSGSKSELFARFFALFFFFFFFSADAAALF